MRYFSAACPCHDFLFGRDVEFTGCWYSELSQIERNPSSRAELSDITYEPCPPLARKAGTSHYPVRSVSLCHKEIDSSLCLSRRRLRYNCIIKGDGLDFGFRLKPRTEYVSRLGELLGYGRAYRRSHTSPRSALPVQHRC